MTLPIDYRVLGNAVDYDEFNFRSAPFIGYINKYGQALDYSMPLGYGGHEGNRYSNVFLGYFDMPTNDDPEDRIGLLAKRERLMHYKDNLEDLKSWIDYVSEETEKQDPVEKEYSKFLMENPESRFLYDLMVFFVNCYSANTLMDGFGQSFKAMNEKEYRAFREECLTDEMIDKLYDKYWAYSGDEYGLYLVSLKLDWFKSVIVQYMHYHLVERCGRGITTSDLKPYETFYNYLLNDFTIHQIPRMMYDKDKKMYVSYEPKEYMLPDSELRLKEEIDAIKKFVPLEKRSKYYR